MNDYFQETEFCGGRQIRNGQENVGPALVTNRNFQCLHGYGW